MYLWSMNYYIYSTIILGLALLLGGWIWRHLAGMEHSRKKRLQGWTEFEAVPSEAPVPKPKRWGFRTRIAKIENRFTITRRMLVVGLALVAGLLVGIPFLGHLPSTLLSLLVAATTVVIGIAAKPLVENVISGLVLTLGKLARIGDTVVVDGQYGIIEDVTLTHCIIKRWDWLRYVVPNSAMLTKEFTNYSLMDHFRWVFVEFWVAYESDLDAVEAIAKQAPLESPYYLNSEEPRFWIVDLTKEGVQCMVVAWATSPPDGWMLSIDIRARLIRAFGAQGIETHSYRVVQDVASQGAMPFAKEKETNLGR